MTPTDPVRFRLHRAGILNVWQYDDQEFELGDGRMLLRGANGAGKSKTLEMLLPFAIDGDKARITASARHHTSLLWLMTDGYDGQARTGYVWVEFARPLSGGDEEVFTCGVGIRSSASAKTARAWYFVTSQRIGRDLFLEDDGGPLSQPRLTEAIGAAGQVFDRPAAYKEHVGRHLFGLAPAQYDEVLRLLYWLRQPQIGEDIEPARLAGQLAQALPQLDEKAVRSAGDTFDELVAYAEQIERRTAASEALGSLAAAYAAYARGAVAARGRAVLDAVREERRQRSALGRRSAEHAELVQRRDAAQASTREAETSIERSRARINELESSPEARDQRRLGELASLAAEKARLAGEAEARAEVAAAAERQLRERHRSATASVVKAISTHADTLRLLDGRQRDHGVDAALPVPPALEQRRLDEATDAELLERALDESDHRSQGVADAIVRRQAAALVLREALGRLELAGRRAETAEREAARSEDEWEGARGRRAETEREVDERAADLSQRLAGWAAEPETPPVDLPDVLDPEPVRSLPELARAAADPALVVLRERRQQASTRITNTRERLDTLGRQRAEVAATRDPAPPAPSLSRTPRPDGASLWRLVDFADHLDPAERAGLEAALEASGLLDAWVRPDGRVLDADQRDVLLHVVAPATGATLADWLRPVPDADTGVAPETVALVLAGIAIADVDVDASAAVDVVAVGVDGSWSLPPLRGRAEKPAAQYIGATARAQERRRRLAELDRLLTEQQAALADAETELADLDARIDRLVDWLRRLPSAADLMAAWTRLDERREAESRAEADNATAQRSAHEARDRAAQARAEVRTLAVTHDLPDEPAALDALDQRLRDLAADLRDSVGSIRSLRRDLERWRADLAEVLTATERSAQAATEAAGLRRDSDVEQARLAELREAVGATVGELETRLRELRDALRAAQQEQSSRSDEWRETEREVAVAERDLAQAHEELTALLDRRRDVLAGLATLGDVPGLVAAAFDESGVASPEPGVLLTAGGLDPAATLPAPLLAAARAFAERAPADEVVDANVVWRAYTEAVSGPAFDHDPTVHPYDELLAVTGRDEAGELPVTALAARVAAAVAADRELLTQRERDQFEQHVLGELGDAIRRSRTEADELVDAMNRLLAGVTTSQGIRVKLDWRLRDDVPDEARQAVDLLVQPVGALLPHERSALRDALHRLIEFSRVEHPELGYADHLANALDYRTWFAFRIRYTRPEAGGSWHDLHRRSPLSQGEQKVLCYLPLFAAAAAHFSSLAGAAPYAPRLVLLDDAFPKIDVRTHPLLFGLLVDLDLDFVITSERLWGDHDTVPSLAIYEALRDPAQRGIAQFEYRWDGRALRSIG